MQRLEQGPAGHHLDLEADDPTAEVARLRDLGATSVAVHHRWRTLAEPVGNLCCVVAW